ncbi:DgyrCDS4133 [Dimorphilus gyrociliatus]|uniref:DgyrCDS4133 n=1 Tax=Dimorphilus gyrociliatus TaxID=2664684 RepID=A0A7I8VFI6_9ANNE|nr:DgyrCDS4133 [Dimorphilus gyrociliatus]
MSFPIEKECTSQKSCSILEECVDGKCKCTLENAQNVCQDSGKLIFLENKQAKLIGTPWKTVTSIGKCYDECLKSDINECVGVHVLEDNNTIQCAIYNTVIFPLLPKNTSLLILRKDKKLGVCGQNSSIIPPTPECYSLLWNQNGCNSKPFQPTPNQSSMSIDEFEKFAKTSFNLAAAKFDKNSDNEYYRLICYDKTVHDYINIAFRRKISYSGQFESYLYHPTHAIDGFTNSDITLGGCVILKPTNTIKSKLEIELSGYHLVKKLIIWPTNQKANQLLAIYIPDSYNVCADDIQMKNDTETIIYCRNLKLRRYSKVVIQQKLQTDLQLCEIEIYSENIAHKKPVYSSYADYSIQSFVDGGQTYYNALRIGDGYSMAINLLGYYNVYAIDIKPSSTSLDTFKDFIMELSDINPFSPNQSITYTFCAEKDSTILTSNFFTSFICPKGGVKGQFVHFYKDDNLVNSFNILEIEIVGKLLKRLSNNETNLLSHKPTWSSSYSQLSSSASTLTDANYETVFRSAMEDNPWARIDLLGKYKIFKMAILNIGNNWQSRSQNIQGVISEKKDFPITNWSNHSQLCFNNNKHFLSGEYRIWNCKQPLPVGRYAVFFVSGQGQYLNVFEVEAYGEEIVDKHFSLLPIIKADRNSQSAGFSDMISENLYPLKAIDRLSSNFIGAKPYFSCTGSFKENTEGRFTVYLDNNYLIHQIVLLLPLVQSSFSFCI